MLIKVYLVLILQGSVAVIPQPYSIETCTQLGKEWKKEHPNADFNCLGVAPLGDGNERAFLFNGREQ